MTLSRRALALFLAGFFAAAGRAATDRTSA
jgi:hypothetical protein